MLSAAQAVRPWRTREDPFADVWESEVVPQLAADTDGGRVLRTMPRLRGAAEHRIDYRHVIGNLVRKPGAFARYRFREELFRR